MNQLLSIIAAQFVGKKIVSFIALIVSTTGEWMMAHKHPLTPTVMAFHSFLWIIYGAIDIDPFMITTNVKSLIFRIYGIYKWRNKGVGGE